MSSSHPREAAVLEHIDLDDLVATLAELIPFESCHGKEVEVQERMAHLMRDMGMEVDRWEIDLDTLSRHPAYGVEIERSRALGVVGRWGSDRGPALILNGHVDVVPAGDPAGWTVPPFEATVRDGRVYGRGSVDMKGALCCALQAVKAIMRAGVTLKGSVRIQSVAGEEDGGLGTLAAIVRGHTGDAAIVMEPTELAVAPAQAGALSFRITLPGRAAHGALRTEGSDPLEGFAPLFEALRALEAERNHRLRHSLFAGDVLPYALCVGKVRAGIWASTVAESLVLEGRYGVGVGESCEDARAEFESAVATAAQGHEVLREHPPTVEWWGARFEPAAIDADHPLVVMVAGAAEAVTGRRPPVRGMSFGADMHLLVNRGAIPTVMFGPGDIRQAHAPDEFVPLADLEVATRTLALSILRFCGAEG